MARVVWTPSAEDDVHRNAAYIAADSPYRASLFVAELYKNTDRLQDFPLSGRIIPEKKDPSFREIIFGNYRIMYRTNDGLVEILRIFHSARIFDESILD